MGRHMRWRPQIVLIGLIVLESAARPEAPRRLLCFPCEVPSKFYPWALVALMCLMSGSIAWDMVIGACVGHLCAWERAAAAAAAAGALARGGVLHADVAGRLERVVPSIARLEAWERGLFVGLASRQACVPCECRRWAHASNGCTDAVGVCACWRGRDAAVVRADGATRRGAQRASDPVRRLRAVDVCGSVCRLAALTCFVSPCCARCGRGHAQTTLRADVAEQYRRVWWWRHRRRRRERWWWWQRRRRGHECLWTRTAGPRSAEV